MSKTSGSHLPRTVTHRSKVDLPYVYQIEDLHAGLPFGIYGGESLLERGSRRLWGVRALFRSGSIYPERYKQVVNSSRHTAGTVPFPVSDLWRGVQDNKRYLEGNASGHGF